LEMSDRSPEPSQAARLIAIDWGTSRFRAYLIDASARILDEVSSDEGISAVRDGAFAHVLAARCGAWFERFPIPVLMAGMVGSRNGWKEAPYVVCPASAEQIRAAVQQIEIGPKRMAGIVPGLICRESGVTDVIRGEETLIIGSGVENGIVVLPGTHSKWAQISVRNIAEFKTYMTGEFYGLLRHNSILGRLAREPEDGSGFLRGVAAQGRAGGLLHQAFEVRTSVLDGYLTGEQVGPFLSGLLIAHEIASATKERGAASKATLVADRPLAQNYSEALAHFGSRSDVLAPRQCFAQGMLQLVPDWLA
jgi:2-dehydro-3-deoxygalactonokinase